MVERAGGLPISDKTWQEKELALSEAIRLITLYHSESTSKLSFGISQTLYPYTDLEDAMDQIEEAFQNPGNLFKSSSLRGEGSGVLVKETNQTSTILKKF